MLSHHSAPLTSSFGYEYAVELFGQAAINALPRRKEGPHRGKPTGFLVWSKDWHGRLVHAECAPGRAGGSPWLSLEKRP